MNAAPSQNLLGITGIARRLVLDGSLDADAARQAQDAATAERKPVASYLVEHGLVDTPALAAAQSMEFGLPVFDPAAMDPQLEAMKLVSPEMIAKHGVLPLFRRGTRLYLGISDPTHTQGLEEIRFQSGSTGIETILIDEVVLKRTLEAWQAAGESFSALMEDAEGLEGLEVDGGERRAISCDCRETRPRPSRSGRRRSPRMTSGSRGSRGPGSHRLRCRAGRCRRARSRSWPCPSAP